MINEDLNRIFRKFKSILTLGKNNMLSNYRNYSTHPLIPEDYQFVSTNEIILQETLIDHFFKIFNSNLIYNKANKQSLEDQLFNFCKTNNINLKINIDNLQEPSGIISNNTIYITIKDTTKEKEFIYLFLHELSHFITNKFSNNKLKQFIKEPLKHNVNINSIDHICKELDYFLSPAEISNWAFTLSLSIYEEKYKSVSELYKLIKDDLHNTKLLFNTKLYNSLSNNIKPLYHLVFYVFQLKQLNTDKYKRKKYKTRLISLIELLDKYVKRLYKLFGKN